MRESLLLVDMKEDSLSSYPLLDFKGKPNAVDELVCFQEAQVLPLFLVIPKTKPAFTPMIVKPPFNLVSQAPPSSSNTQSAPSGDSSSTLPTIPGEPVVTLSSQEIFNSFFVLASFRNGLASLRCHRTC